MSCFFSLLVLNLGLIVSETSFRSGPHLHKVKSALNHNKKKRHFHQNRLLSENPAVNQLYPLRKYLVNGFIQNKPYGIVHTVWYRVRQRGSNSFVYQYTLMISDSIFNQQFYWYIKSFSNDQNEWISILLHAVPCIYHMFYKNDFDLLPVDDVTVSVWSFHYFNRGLTITV